jgi:hypothetical protein
MKQKSIFLLLPLLIVLALVTASVCVAQPPPSVVFRTVPGATPAPPPTWGQPGYQQVPSQGGQPGYHPAPQPPGYQQVPPRGGPLGYHPPPAPINPPGPLVVLFEHIDYGGRTKVFEGSTLRVGRDFNDIASSLLVPPGYCVILYENSDYGGRSKQFCENTPRLGDRFDGIVSSFEVVPIDRGHEDRGPADRGHGGYGR